MDVLRLSDNSPCTRLLLSYFKGGRVISEELNEQVIVVSRDQLAGFILKDKYFSSSELKEIICAASYVLKGQCDDK